MKKLFLSLLATTLIFSACGKDEEPKEKEVKEKEEVVELCEELDIEYSYEEGKEVEFLENTFNHYKEIQDNNGIYFVTSYSPVRNSMLDLYYVYNSFNIMEDCSTVGIIDGESSGYSYNSDDRYDASIVYKFSGKEKSIYEYDYDNNDDIVIDDIYDDEDEFEKMYDSINVSILDKYIEDMVDDAIKYEDFEIDEEYEVVSFSAWINTKEYGEIPLYIDLDMNGEYLYVYLYTYYNNDILSEDEKNEPAEFYVTFGKSELSDLYEDVNDSILDFEKE